MRYIFKAEMKTVILETSRLVLRRWKPEDFSAMAKINADPRVMEFFPGLLTYDESKTMIELIESKTEKNGFGFWAAEFKTTEELIGFIGLNIPGYPLPFAPCVEVGWRLATAQWGQGLATEGARAVLDLAFNKFGLNEIVAFTAEHNLRSRRVMEKIGMVHHERESFPHPLLSKSHPLSKHVLYRIASQQVKT